MPLFHEPFQRQAARRPARCVESVTVTLCLASQTMANKSPPMPLPVGSIRSQRRVGGDGRVDGIAAPAHDVQRDLRGQRMAGSRHGVRRDDVRARGEGLAGDAISGQDGFVQRKQGEQGRNCPEFFDPRH